ncbi:MULTISPECIES: Hpt domain-containing protein [unclassified Maridesulfovibrio]|uniref:Hpt domain-containing protein n=1 Tax=unclassified Maridesulfovibrio TaxID=2794999 RepID=UPI003B3CED27
MDSELIKIVEKHLLEKVGLPSEKLVDFLKETSIHLKVLMDALDEGIDEGQFEVVVSSAHTLKGSLVNLGLDELSKIAGNIETAAYSTSPLYLSCYFMRLRKMLIPLLDYANKK